MWARVDAMATMLPFTGLGLPCQQEQGREVDRQHAVPRLQRGLGERAVGIHSGIGDDGIDTARARERGFDKPLDVGRVADIGNNGAGSGGVRSSMQRRSI
jgi:hypothetical protein